MPIVNSFSTTSSLGQLMSALDSVGAHIAAKLQVFGSDERTLTDDLCDMFYLWSNRNGPNLYSEISDAFNRKLNLTIRKITPKQEAQIGADLALILRSPLGMKVALFQAKVFDPQDYSLRCDSPAGWANLGKQLGLARRFGRDSAYLQLYVPAGLLANRDYAFKTWEQEIPRPATGKTENA